MCVALGRVGSNENIGFSSKLYLCSVHSSKLGSDKSNAHYVIVIAVAKWINNRKKKKIIFRFQHLTRKKMDGPLIDNVSHKHSKHLIIIKKSTDATHADRKNETAGADAPFYLFG